MSTFRPSKLGTKEHWDLVYDEEIQNFDELGDEGEIWFGEDSMEKMVDWTISNAPPPRRILEIGSGNGVLLCELAKNSYDSSLLAGIDYSPGSVSLSKQVARSRDVDGITFELCDFLTEDPPRLIGMLETNSWDLLLDKGTFDAIALAEKDPSGKSPMDIYPSRCCAQAMEFLIETLTPACNFTEDELKETFAADRTGLRYHSRIQHKTYSYGGKSGSVCASVAFQKQALPSE